MKTWRATLAAALLAALVVSATMAVDEVYEWTHLGTLRQATGPEPYINVIAPHAADPTVLYVGTLLTTPDARLIYRSQDSGDTWQPADAGLPQDFPANTGIDALAVHPTDPNVLYAGPRAHGVWRSEDGGASWQSVSGGSVGQSDTVVALAIDPGPPLVVYALTEFGVHSSTGGRPWQKRVSGLPPAATVVFNTLTLDPTDPDTLYVATNPRGVFRSANGGKKWADANGNLPSGTRNVKGISISPVTGEVFLSLRGAGLFRSANDGRTWTLSHSGITYVRSLFGTISAPALSQTDPMLAYAYNSDSIFRSEDGGTTWTPHEHGLSALVTVSALAAHPTQPQSAYAGSSISGLWAIKGAADPRIEIRLFVPVVQR